MEKWEWISMIENLGTQLQVRYNPIWQRCCTDRSILTLDLPWAERDQISQDTNFFFSANLFAPRDIWFGTSLVKMDLYWFY